MIKHQVSDQVHIHQLEGVFGLMLPHMKLILKLASDLSGSTIAA